jgi:hypothetical protein
MKVNLLKQKIKNLVKRIISSIYSNLKKIKKILNIKHKIILKFKKIYMKNQKQGMKVAGNYL